MSEPFDFSKIKFDDSSTVSKLADPAPKKAPAKKTTGKLNSPGPGRPTKQSRIKEMQEEIIGFMSIAALPLKMRDRHPDGTSCGDMFITEEMEPTAILSDWAFKFAVIGVDNKYISKFFDMGDDVSKYLMLAMATQPFVMGAIGYHMNRGSNNAPHNPLV